MLITTLGRSTEDHKSMLEAEVLAIGKDHGGQGPGHQAVLSRKSHQGGISLDLDQTLVSVHSLDHGIYEGGVVA